MKEEIFDLTQAALLRPALFLAVLVYVRIREDAVEPSLEIGSDLKPWVAAVAA